MNCPSRACDMYDYSGGVVRVYARLAVVGGMKIPFGKYEGESINRVVAKDPEYLEWLIEQEWFQDKYPELLEEIEHRLDTEYGW